MRNGYYDDMGLNSPVAEALPEARATFIRKTYMHLAGAIAVFAVAEAAIFYSGMANNLMESLRGSSKIMMFVMLGLVIAGSWVSQTMAASQNRATQYAGLGLYTGIEVLTFIPILWFAANFCKDGVIAKAGVITLVLVAALSAVVFTTRKDFSFMRTGLMIFGFIALGTVICGMIFGFQLGLWFSALMIMFAAGMILYTTSNILHHYSTENYVGASLELFSSVMLLFYYVLRLFTSRDE
ncbi:MAG: hypothetical protein RL095_523 [Verrucomicrobiota bacterium]|jgi:FtsH-binding integral membrane protein